MQNFDIPNLKQLRQLGNVWPRYEKVTAGGGVVCVMYLGLKIMNNLWYTAFHHKLSAKSIIQDTSGPIPATALRNQREGSLASPLLSRQPKTGFAIDQFHLEEVRENAGKQKRK
jgi:hypothetical protein